MSSHVVNDIDIKSHLATSLLGSSKEIQKDRTENFIEVQMGLKFVSRLILDQWVERFL